MENVKISKFPNYTWLNVTFDVKDLVFIPYKSVNHVVSLVLSGSRDLKLIGPKKETEWTETTGTIHILPADGNNYKLITQNSSNCRVHNIFIPKDHFITSEFIIQDDILKSSIKKIVEVGPKDDVARTITRRIFKLNGKDEPNWNDNFSIFDAQTLENLVNKIDAHLLNPVPTWDLAVLCGLSINHFSRKFCRSVGCSLNRFINRRRSQAAILEPSKSLAQLSLDLGFVSQSHFTKVFKNITGMTPAKCRRYF